MKQPTASALLTKFIVAISRASSAAWCLVHARQLTAFLPIRDRLELVKQKCLKIAVKHTHQGNNPEKPRATLIRN